MQMPSNSSAEILLPAPSHSFAITYSLGVLWFITVAIVSWLWFRKAPDSKEPPILDSKIPWIGHLLGIIQYEADYFTKLSTRQSWPIFTLKIFTARIYVITSPELVQAVFRNPKSISFDPIASKGSERIFAVPKDQMTMLEDQQADGSESAIRRTTRGMHTSMQPGANLLQMNSRALNCFALFLKDIGTVEQHIKLYNWVRDHFTIASCEALYGRENPLAEDSSLIQSLEEFESSIGLLFLNIAPSITARKAYQARLSFAKAFRSYYTRGLVKNASGIVRGRYADLTGGGLKGTDIAGFEIGIVMATTMNSVTGMFWMLCYLFSDPELLEEIRAEVSSITKRSEDGKEVCLDVSGLQKSCPLLVSTWQETLRMANVAVSQRLVIQDILLNDTYLLKANSVVQIPARIMHESASIWGPDAHVFNARRFLKENVDKMTREQKKLQKQGFTPFGGGVVLCPGRHFATTEILGVAATVVLGFEIRMADGTGALKVPRGAKQRMSVAVKQPEGDLDVLIKRREEYEGVNWTYDVGGEVDEKDMVF